MACRFGAMLRRSFWVACVGVFLVMCVITGASERTGRVPRYIVTDLGALEGTWSAAYAINQRSVVVGTGEDRLGETRAFQFPAKNGKKQIESIGAPKSSAW